ncbi:MULTISPECIES: hypothetical protein [Methanosarcina]|uniref:Transcriptional regulator, MarR family n=3 Tax=Methanosarcina barkeri TaxID=2208 RepID=A0A0E3QVN7_METBA|nr:MULTISPECIES: hypothetical protein [Methanosarcina]AKB54735.1 Transcriptional regulator, MarR family [Methanosarcina barkeri MS]
MKKTFLFMKRDVLESIIFDQRFQKKIMNKFRELSTNQPKVIKIIGLEGKITPSTIRNYTGTDKQCNPND